MGNAVHKISICTTRTHRCEIQLPIYDMRKTFLPTAVSEDLLRKVIFWGGDGARKILGTERERQDMRASEMRFCREDI